MVFRLKFRFLWADDISNASSFINEPLVLETLWQEHTLNVSKNNVEFYIPSKTCFHRNPSQLNRTPPISEKQWLDFELDRIHGGFTEISGFGAEKDVFNEKGP